VLASGYALRRTGTTRFLCKCCPRRRRRCRTSPPLARTVGSGDAGIEAGNHSSFGPVDDRSGSDLLTPERATKRVRSALGADFCSRPGVCRDPASTRCALVATSRTRPGLGFRTCFAFTEGVDPGMPTLPLRVGSGRPDESAAEATKQVSRSDLEGGFVTSLGGEATLLLSDLAGKAVSDQASRFVFARMGKGWRADGPAPRSLGPFQDSLATKYLA
jgi:hypothetical protein